MGNNPYPGVAEQKLQKRNSDLEAQLKIVEKYANPNSPILDLTVGELVEALNKKQLTSVQIVSAFALRAGTKGRQLCLITETNFQYAIEAGEKCDEKRKTSGKKNWTFADGQFSEEKFLPPLFGIPISVKDTFNMEGFSSTVGLCSRANQIFQESNLIKCLKNSGMIPFVRTNIPQLGMTFQSTNFLWGRALNPWNTERSVGGSSGGEGALVAAKGSPIGMGSDIGGSIRIPAQFCGVFSIKPYSKRFASSYHTTFSKAFTGGAFGIPLCLGPLTKSTEDIALWFKVTTHEDFYDELDPYVKNIPFNDLEYFKSQKKNYTIGYFKNFDLIQSTQTSQRAVDETIEILKKQGHTVKEVSIPNASEIITEFFIEVSSNGGQMYRELLAGEKEIPEYKTLFMIAGFGSISRWFASGIMNKLMPRLGNLIEKTKEISTLDYQKHLGRIVDYRTTVLKYWRDQKLDFIICPGFGCQPNLHGKSEHISLAASYTVIWNVLDLPVGTMPITLSKQTEEVYESVYDDMITKELKATCQGSKGLPAGIQIVALPYEEEKILGFMARLEKEVKFYEKYPLPKME